MEIQKVTCRKNGFKLADERKTQSKHGLPKQELKTHLLFKIINSEQLETSCKHCINGIG